MSIRYFGNEPSFNIESSAELREALDILHTQVIDNLPEETQAPYLRVLEKAMEELEALPLATRGEIRIARIRARLAEKAANASR